MPVGQAAPVLTIILHKVFIEVSGLRDGRNIQIFIHSVDGMQLLGENLHKQSMSFWKAAAVDTINALLGWVPMRIAAVMFVIVFFHPIEKEMAAMRVDKE